MVTDIFSLGGVLYLFAKANPIPTGTWAPTIPCVEHTCKNNRNNKTSKIENGECMNVKIIIDQKCEQKSDKILAYNTNHKNATTKNNNEREHKNKTKTT